MQFFISSKVAEQYKPIASEGDFTNTFYKTSSSIYKVLSFPEFNSSIRFWLISKPTTGNFVANNLASGNPTYHKKIIARRGDGVMVWFCDIIFLFFIWHFYLITDKKRLWGSVI